MRNTLRILVVLAVVLSATFTVLANSPQVQEGGALLLAMDSPQRIDGQYIVVFKAGAAAKTVQAAIDVSVDRMGGSVLYRYTAALNGFAAKLPDAAVQALQKNPNVAYIEADQLSHIVGDQSPATWGIDRIDQRDRPLSNSYHWDYDGTGVHAYIIDTGIRISHNEFGGRASYGYNAVGSGNPADDHGHGTHVAGTVGGSTYGVAKNVQLYAVKVCTSGGSCPNSAIIAGVNWVTSNHNSPAVANMSLGGSASTSIDNAVNNSINAGVVYAVAAGNDSANACNYSPARVNAALTAGSSTSSDSRSSFSNYGSCVDVFAPGSSITSAYYTSNSATATMSGTSMASPHVCGVAALVRDANPGYSTSQVFSAIVNGATQGRLSGIGSGSPNLLLYSLLDAGPQPTNTPTPTPSGDWIYCADEGETCTFSGTRTVRYGANGYYNYLEATNSIACNNSTFGDPIVGTEKQCHYSSDGPTPTPTNTPVGPTNTPPPGGTIFFDNFETSLGWVRDPNGTDTATTGLWERANPDSTSYSGTTYQLGTTASGSYDLVTEGSAGSSVGSYDIDNGVTSIRSPNITLPSGSGITLSFSYYLAHYNNATSADFLRVSVVGSTTQTVFEELGAGNIDGASWASFSTSLDAYAGQTIYLLIEAADAGSGSLVEAAVDDVLIEQ